MPVKTIVLEGVDCSGKSSICSELIKSLDAKQFHFAFPKGNTVEEKYGFQFGQFDMLFEMINIMDGSLILDRAWAGEYVYGPKYRDRFPDYLRGLEEHWQSLPIALVYVECKPEIVHQRHLDRGEEAPRVKDIDLLQSRFSVFCKHSPFYLRTVRTDLGSSPRDIADSILNQIKEENRW